MKKQASCSHSHGFAYETIHNRLQFCKVCARWVLKQLWNSTGVTAWTSVTDFSSGIMKLTKHVSIFMNQRANVKSIEWKHLMLPIKRKFKSQSAAGRVMPSLFWDS
jgi:hypothetical protein